MLFVLDGPEGTGKTTVSKEVVKRLHEEYGSEKIEWIRCPGGTEVGSKIRDIIMGDEEYSKNTELFLLLADRAQLIDEYREKIQDPTYILICDRWAGSTIAYQGATGVDLQLVKDQLAIVEEGITPQLTFYLSCNAEESLHRKQVQGEVTSFEMRGIPYHERVVELYDQWYEDAIKVNLPFTKICTVENSMDEVTRQIHSICRGLTVYARMKDGK